ncbi:TRAP-type C4-dicarboxylate transport system, small permease component [Tistlia consotensis]|uniref:TRAP transporter small permease protein n=1 Tax=Tistlia consotensis USBA 355 TaxID=560819 RepID=A0A1Y6BEI6_9PROT|nr:TRAP transporter small permease [Tistlia consotensis]SME97437.1 TRAP-type C4-dicarboxylate transport system, small permease component [Tistlia consotensis USBA 355]SNR56773.1 TRAP-type C4-dicarboxylate transport system, small permease component [Tistlia consotensis]
MLRTLERVAEVIGLVTGVAARLMILAVVAMLFVQVVLRFGFRYSLPWPEEASRYLMIWVVMLAGSLLVKDEQLVSVDFFDRLWPPRLLAYRNAFFRLMLAGLLAVLFWEGLGEALFDMRRTTTALQISWFWVYLSIPVGSGLMLFHMLVLALRDLVRGVDPDRDPSLLRAEI